MSRHCKDIRSKYRRHNSSHGMLGLAISGLMTLIFAHGCTKSSQKKPPSLVSTIFNMVEETSLSFTRGPDQKTGIFRFAIKPNHKCRVEYWSTDPNVTPNASAPLAIECPEGITDVKITVTNLSPTSSYKFKVYAWKVEENIGQAQTLIFTETSRPSQIDTAEVVVLMHDTPSRASQLHAFRFGDTLSTEEIESRIINQYQFDQSGRDCDPSDNITLQLLDPTLSAEPSANPPLLNLSDISSSGYGTGRMQSHPYYQNRLIQDYLNGVEENLTWVWKFRWKEQPSSLSAWPPSYWQIDSLGIDVDGRNYIQTNKDLESTVPALSIDSVSPFFNLKYKQTKLGFIKLSIKPSDSMDESINCVYRGDSDRISIPNQLWASLAEGNYDVIATYEVAQLQFNGSGNFPPWLVLTKDWIYFRLNKRLP